MKRFAAGSDVVLINAACLASNGRAFIGEDAIVHFELRPDQVPPQLKTHPAGDDAPFYAVSFRDGIRTVLCGHCLRAKPEDAHTWAGIAALTGWRPPAASTANRPNGDHA